VAAQALFELGRAEEAFDLVLRYYPSGTPAGTARLPRPAFCMQALAGKPIPSHPHLTPILPAAGTAGFSRVPPALLTLLCRLRLHLDKGDAAAAERMMAGYVAVACEETSRDAAMRGPDPISPVPPRIHLQTPEMFNPYFFGEPGFNQKEMAIASVSLPTQVTGKPSRHKRTQPLPSSGDGSDAGAVAGLGVST